MKKWPSNYYATEQECKNSFYKSATPKKAQKAGIYGWRSFSKESLVKPENK